MLGVRSGLSASGTNMGSATTVSLRRKSTFMKDYGLILKLTCGEGPPTSGTQMISGEGLHRVNETNDAWMTEDVPLEVANKTLWEEALEMERTYRTGGLQET